MKSLLQLEAHLIRQLVSGLKSGYIAAPYSKKMIESQVHDPSQATGILDDLNELAELGIKDRATAHWIESVNSHRDQQNIPELVWTGPEMDGVRSRDTNIVFRETFSSASESLWATTYGYYDGQRAFEELAARMDAAPGLYVNLLLNVHRKFNDQRSSDLIVEEFADRFWNNDWPGSRKPRVFYYPPALDPDRSQRAVLHAKTFVIDEKVVYITSANLTEAARERNIEVGVRLQDRHMALQLIRHYRAMISQKLLELLPGQSESA